jgi:L,D-transpeptidase-like protein
MRVFTNLLFKVTLSSMVLTAPAMIDGHMADGRNGASLRRQQAALSFYSSEVIRKFVDHPTVTAMRAFVEAAEGAHPIISTLTAAAAAPAMPKRTVVRPAMPVPLPSAAVEAAIAAKESASHAAVATKASVARAFELRMVISQAALIYSDMNLEAQGLNEKAFEYAWRGYHNLVKKGLVRKRSVLSICDFSQSSREKRMYVIDVKHKRLLYRTYVAHGQNSGDEYATSFSNEPDSYKSSLGFYVTQRTYIGHNGLSLKLNGVDSGYNDMARKRQIVLHGSTYVSDKYMQDFGTLGTSLGCPAIPESVSRPIIRLVKGGSCLFIYHPTDQYLANSTVINNW